MDRLDSLLCAVFLLLAIVFAGVAQSFWFRSGWSAPFQIPIDGGRSFRGKRLFGDNKTWRGFVVMIPALGAAFFVLHWLYELLPERLTGARVGLWPLTDMEYALLGCWAGFGFMAGELPNSFCKRRLEISPGSAPVTVWAKVLCFLADRLDSIGGALLALALFVPIPWGTLVILLVIGPVIHWSFSVLLFYWRVKARPA